MKTQLANEEQRVEVVDGEVHLRVTGRGVQRHGGLPWVELRLG
jgi:hypothetical protein